MFLLYPFQIRAHLILEILYDYFEVLQRHHLEMLCADNHAPVDFVYLAHYLLLKIDEVVMRSFH